MGTFDKLIDNTTCKFCGGSGIFLSGSKGNFMPQRCVCKTEGQLSQRADREIPNTWYESHIPNTTYQTLFDADKLEGPADLGISQQQQFSHYSVTLTQIIEMMSANRKPTWSYFISSPNNYGKRYFAYSLMMVAYRKGLNPSPLYSLWELTRFASNQRYIMQLLDCDMFFLSNSVLFTEESISVLKILLDLCEMRGIPLIFISREGVHQILNIDRDFDYKVTPSATQLNSFSDMQYIYLPSSFRKPLLGGK